MPINTPMLRYATQARDKVVRQQTVSSTPSPFTPAGFQKVRTSFIGKPHFSFDLDRCCDFPRDPNLGRQRVDGMVVPDRRQVPFIVYLGVRNPIRSSIPRTRFEVLRERSESGGREWAQHVGHGDPRATDESSIRVGPAMAGQFGARTQVCSAVGTRVRTGRIRHRAGGEG